jgi:gas vesicle protein
MRKTNSEYSDYESTQSGGGISSNLMYFLIGGGIGATVALLFAPKSGAELRQDIGEVSRRGYDGTVELAGKLKDQSNQLYSTIKDKADNVYGFAADKLHLGQGAGLGEIADKTVEAGRQIAENTLENGGIDSGQKNKNAGQRPGNIH